MLCAPSPAQAPGRVRTGTALTPRSASPCHCCSAVIISRGLLRCPGPGMKSPVEPPDACKPELTPVLRFLLLIFISLFSVPPYEISLLHPVRWFFSFHCTALVNIQMCCRSTVLKKTPCVHPADTSSPRLLSKLLGHTSRPFPHY